MQLNVNTDATVILTNKLEKLHKSAFPIAVRSTLNSAAFDMKKDTILSSAKSNFTQRKPSFFKANSRVETAKGFDVTSMSSSVGFTGNSQAVDDLEKQEHGGEINKRTFIPFGGKGGANPARSGNSYSKNIKPNARLKSMKIIDSKKASGKSDKEKFIKSVIHAGVGGFVLGNTNNILWRVNSIKGFKKGELKLTPLYTFEKGRKVDVKATNFMKEATENTSQKMDNFYTKNAQVQFDKVLK
jgi:hypothetical protein